MRCAWVPAEDPLYVAYHDREWGVPVHDDALLFEYLCLEGAQAGLSWRTILYRRAHYREVFQGFVPERVAAFTALDIARLLEDPGIVRNRKKVEAAVENARLALDLALVHGSLDAFFWQFVGGRPHVNHWHSTAELPAESDASRAMSRALRSAGLRFVGPTICYAFMQATGMVMDHVVDCFRYGDLAFEHSEKER